MEAIGNMNHIALKSAPTSPAKYNWDPDITGSPIAKLVGKDFEYIMRQKRIVIGRHSSTHGDVDINMGHSSFVSRKHVEIIFENSHFYFKCEGKNGIFVDDEFQRKSKIPMALPCRCCFRFPSTQIKIMYESLIDEFNPPLAIPSRPPSPHKNLPTSSSKTSFTPLEISIPEHGLYYQSQIPSPCGTISAANSCPTSPRSAGIVTRYPVVSSEGGVLGQQPAGLDLGLVDPEITSSALSNHSDISSNSDCSPHAPSGMICMTSGIGMTSEIGSSLCSPLAASGLQPSPSGSSNDLPLLAPPISTTISMSTEPGGVVNPTKSSIPAGARGGGGSKGSDKPPYSYAQLIIQAIAAAPERQLTLSGIYSYIISHYPYYAPSDKGWQNSIRHNLSLNRYFVKVARSQDEPGKGSFWRIEELSEAKLLNQAFKKRRNRGIPGFRSPYLSVSSSDVGDGAGRPSSAPSSPLSTTSFTSSSYPPPPVGMGSPPSGGGGGVICRRVVPVPVRSSASTPDLGLLGLHCPAQQPHPAHSSTTIIGILPPQTTTTSSISTSQPQTIVLNDGSKYSRGNVLISLTSQPPNATATTSTSSATATASTIATRTITTVSLISKPATSATSQPQLLQPIHILQPDTTMQLQPITGQLQSATAQLHPLATQLQPVTAHLQTVATMQLQPVTAELPPVTTRQL